MATHIITDLDQQLASLNQLKAPGASKGKITSITALCVNNIQAESNIVQSLYRALKKAPATHKLGALYVIDSVTRQWIDKAKQNGQDLHVEGRGEPGTYSAAVKRVTELLPALLDDILKGIPQDQCPKLENVLNIWEKGSVFPSKLLSEFKAKLSQQAPAAANVTAPVAVAQKPAGEKFRAVVPTRPITTPVGYPPQHLYAQGLINGKTEPSQANGTSAAPQRPPQTMQQQQAPPPPAQDVNNILAALANAAPKPAVPQPVQQPAAPAPPALPQQLPPNIAALFAHNGGPPGFIPPPQPQPTPYAQPPMPQSTQMPNFPLPQGFPGFPPQPPSSVPQPYSVAPPPPQQAPAPPSDPLAPLRGILPPNILADNDKLMMALNLLQDLQKQGLPMDQWGPILKAFDDAQPSPQQPSYDNRRRSRSPERRGGRGSPVYGTYDEIAAKTNGNRRPAAALRDRYRQRSPIHNLQNLTMRSSPGPLAMNGAPMQPKYIGIDSSLPPDHIKVLSRTLFVGGANGTQAEILALFSRFGEVQTCIANKEKRHAFVKMTTRNYALAAKQAMEEMQNRNEREVMQIARQTKWGVGFGPRECCNYASGESVIPIYKLTDADLKWLLTAEYGGTGGKPLEGGMVLEEPDIEIGAGVSSKAMSKRVMPNDSGPPATHNNSNNNNHNHKRHKEDKRHGHHGGKRARHNDYDGKAAAAEQYGGYGGPQGYVPQQGPVQMESYGYERLARPEPVAVATPPAVPTFGFSLPGQGYR